MPPMSGPNARTVTDRPGNQATAQLAEDFFADRYGLPHHDGPDLGWDFLVPNRLNRLHRSLVVDVKWTPHLKGALICERRAFIEGSANVFILVVGMPGTFRLAGFAWRQTLGATEWLKGDVPCFGLEQRQLHPNVDLLMAAQGYDHH